MSKNANRFRSCPFFSNLPAPLLGEMSNAARTMEIPRGTVLFSQEDPARALYLLEDGRIDLVRIACDGREHLVRHVRTGEIFAEAAMFSGRGYPVTAIARTRSRVARLAKEDFIRLVKRHPELAMGIIAVMAGLLQHLNAQLTGLTQTPVIARLAAFLLDRRRRAGIDRFPLGIPKKELAMELGTIPETLSRALAKLKTQKVITLQKDLVTLQDHASLEEIATGDVELTPPK